MAHCIFCQDISAENSLAESDYFFAVLDIEPIQAGHLLLISKAHYTNIREIPTVELHDLFHFEKSIVALLEDSFELSGVSTIRNNGKTMDVGTHFHTHLVPRYAGDEFWKHVNPTPHELDLAVLKEKLLNLEI